MQIDSEWKLVEMSVQISHELNFMEGLIHKLNKSIHIREHVVKR